MTTTQERTDELVPVWEDPRDAGYSWARPMFSAGATPQPLLYQDVVRAYAEASRVCWEDVASPMAQMHIVRFLDGFMYSRGPEMDDAAQARLEKWLAYQDGLGNRGIYYQDIVRPEVIELVGRLKKHPRPTRPLAELVSHLEDCMEAYAHIMGDLHWRMAAGSMKRVNEGVAYDWPDVYADITGRPGAEGPMLLGGLVNEMTLTTRMLRKLARIAQTDPGLQQAVESGDVKALDVDRPPFEKFRSGFRSLLRRYGHRTGAGFGSSVGLGSPTWNLRPEIPLKLIASYSRSDLDAVERKERDVARERKRLLREVRKALASDRDRLARFEREFAERSLLAWMLEDHNDRMDQSSPGLVRDAAHVVGLRLVRDGVIDDPGDVLHLSLDELRSPPSDGRMLVAERQLEHARRLEMTPPQTIGDAGPPPARTIFDEGEGHIGNELRGVAASSGRFTGTARVCLPSPIPPDVGENEILVAVDAGPDWTPLFSILGAVVLDKGAAWQHAAVVAREFGVPAVTGTKVGTNVITDGQTITVDGDVGVVELS
jgi:phosphohistidine swiveling domain-containing protein